MEAIAARTALSKGGVYRFFANKREVALALYTRCYDEHLDFEIDDAVAWGLPISETISCMVLAFKPSMAVKSTPVKR
jgi:AcrR family transcriptional regulator